MVGVVMYLVLSGIQDQSNNKLQVFTHYNIMQLLFMHWIYIVVAGNAGSDVPVLPLFSALSLRDKDESKQFW